MAGRNFIQFLFETSQNEASAEAILEELEHIEDLKIAAKPLLTALKALGITTDDSGLVYTDEGVAVEASDNDGYSSMLGSLHGTDAVNKLAEMGWVAAPSGDHNGPQEAPSLRIYFLQITKPTGDGTDNSDDVPDLDALIGKARKEDDEPDEEQTKERKKKEKLGEADKKTKTCTQCGKKMRIDSSGVSTHICDETGGIDHDADADHVPYDDVEEAVSSTMSSVETAEEMTARMLDEEDNRRLGCETCGGPVKKTKDGHSCKKCGEVRAVRMKEPKFMQKEKVEEGKNHMGERSFQTYGAWMAAVKKIKPDAKFDGDKDICCAPGVGEWDGETGSIYDKKKKVEENYANVRKYSQKKKKCKDCGKSFVPSNGEYARCPDCMKTPPGV